ncbi:MAG: hypothetical protein H0U10_07880 [Chloroflexia bacterium]|nr:hypothetical protein [Chloroflexia bacterium]
MLRRFWSFVHLLGRAATYALGLLVLAGLLLGPVSFGLAAVGDALKLGKANNNAETKITGIVADLAGPVLRLTNQGVGPALDLKVEAGNPPLKVNSAEPVVNLNADLLDGQEAAAFQAAPGCSNGTVFVAGVCIETAKRNQANWQTAQNTCFSFNQGARLPTVGELQGLRGDGRFDFTGTEWSSALVEDGATNADLIIRVNGTTADQSFLVQSSSENFRCAQTPG